MGRLNISDKISEYRAALERYGGLPSSTENLSLRQKINYFFKNYSSNEEIKKLGYIYAIADFYPLKDSQFGHRKWEDSLSSYINWKQNVSLEYIGYVLEHYGVFPHENTKPMKELQNLINRYLEYADGLFKRESLLLIDFVKMLKEKGIDKPFINEIYNTSRFPDEDVQKHVYEIIKKNGACAVGYISKVAIPGFELPEKYVYSYYYNKNNRNVKDRSIGPLSNFDQYDSKYANKILYVHYRDYKLCNIKEIRDNAIKFYRNWAENPPKTIDEWRAFGQYCFFSSKHESSYDYESHTVQYLEIIDWSKTIIDYCMQKGFAYFRMRMYDYGYWKYLDYYLFLLENGYELKDIKLKETFGDIISTSDFVEEDRIVKEKIIKLQHDNVIDDNGVIYNKSNKRLLLFTKDLDEYCIADGCVGISPGAYKYCPSLTLLSIPSSLSNAEWSIPRPDNCKIIIPFNTEANFRPYFSKSDNVFLPDGQHIDYSPVIISGCLMKLKYAIDYTLPDEVISIDEHAFDECPELETLKTTRNSQLKYLKNSIFGSLKKLKSVDFNWCKDMVFDGGIFEGASALTSITLPSSIKSISGPLFKGCENLKDVPNGIKRITKSMFEGCKSITEVSYLKYITEIGEFAFKDCVSLSKFDMQPYLCLIEKNAFENCESLESFSFQTWGTPTINCIKSNTFKNCTSLKSVSLCDSIEKIESYAFMGCKSLESITIPNPNCILENDVFEGCTSLKEITLHGEPHNLKRLFHTLTDSILTTIYVDDEFFSDYKASLEPFFASKIMRITDYVNEDNTSEQT